MVFGRGTPGGAGIVDQDIDVAEALQRFRYQRRDSRLLRQIGGNRAGVDAARLEMGHRFIEIGLLARRQNDFRALLAQSFGNLQTQPARSASHERGLPGKVK